MTEAEQLLKDLVEALEATYWSSWQGTYKFDKERVAAEEYLKIVLDKENK